MQIKRSNQPPDNASACLIPIGKGKHAIVDGFNYASLTQFAWRTQKSHSVTYVVRRFNRYHKTLTISMHRQIMHPLPDEQVHHINGDTLDNREANLVNVSQAVHTSIQSIQRITRKIEGEPRGVRPSPANSNHPARKCDTEQICTA